MEKIRGRNQAFKCNKCSPTAYYAGYDVATYLYSPVDVAVSCWACATDSMRLATIILSIQLSLGEIMTIPSIFSHFYGRA